MYSHLPPNPYSSKPIQWDRSAAKHVYSSIQGSVNDPNTFDWLFQPQFANNFNELELIYNTVYYHPSYLF